MRTLSPAGYSPEILIEVMRRFHLFLPLTQICTRYAVSLEEMLGQSRTPTLVRARRECMLFLRELGMSSTEVGKLLGRDHTTVLGAVAAYRREMAGKPEEVARAAERSRMRRERNGDLGAVSQHVQDRSSAKPAGSDLDSSSVNGSGKPNEP